MEDPGQYVSHMMGTVAPAAVMRSDERMMQTESQAFITPWVEWALPSNALAPVLYVNQKGERFMNEEIGYFMSGPTIDKQPEGLFWAFWDGDSETKVKPHKFDRLVDGIDTDEHSEMMVEAGLLIKADTIDELVEKMNAPEWDNGKFDGEKFKETLARYNELCAVGSDDDFYKPAEWMTTIDTPPFYAAEMGSSWMTTVGGLEIDTALHVLDVNRQAIPGLYAGGNPAGCFYGNIYAPQVPHEPLGPFHDALLRGRAQLRRRHLAPRRPGSSLQRASKRASVHSEPRALSVGSSARPGESSLVTTGRKPPGMSAPTCRERWTTPAKARRRDRWR